MGGPSTDVFKPEAGRENLSINSVLKQSYKQAKMHLHDGMNTIKEDLLELYDLAESQLRRMVLPVNNFLKDQSEIDAELRQELNKDMIRITPPAGAGTIIPIEQALSGMMEENY